MPAATKDRIPVIGWDFINDLSALPDNEDIITDFLLARLQNGQIYTWVGSLLLTLNPNDEISTSHLYTSSEFDKYVNAPDIYRTNPHIFAVAAKAHYNLTKEVGRNGQVIVISGETGTGKTFNACKCLEFLSSINKNLVAPHQGDCPYNIMQKITEACRLISAFATACTEKNEVSSRHGQLIRLHYKSGIISGASINSFLLERSRVTKGSRNFQIFYQMIFGMSCAELEAFYLSKDTCYDILSVIDCNKGKYFQESFQDTLKALDVLGFKADQKKHIFQVLALIIHMGNIKFVEDGETCTIDLNDNKSRKAVESTCVLSALTEDTMNELLTTILINPQSTWRKHTSYHRHLVTVDACRNRLHSIIRHMYDLLFHWILSHTNNALSIKDEYKQWLGILDIFGFEAFDKNGIEQLCVNYANEKLQQYFIETYMENGRKDLEEEGFIESYDSPRHSIHLYQQRLNIVEENLFLILNDACQNPMAANASTVTRLALRNLTNVEGKFLSGRQGNFVIQHYCGPVAYSVDDLLSKNTDKVPTEISLIFNESKNKFLRSLINIEKEQHFHAVKMSTKRRTMLAKLKFNMDTLIKELSKGDLHYVRCVRPNRSPNYEWDRKNFQKQLACIGIFDALPLARCKYPIRLSYEDFYRRYSKIPTEVVDINKCKLLLESMVPNEKLHTIYFGKQLIFLTDSIFYRLESDRNNYRIKCANKIKTFWLKHRCKTVPAFSKYSTINNQDECKPDKNVTPVELKFDHEVKKSNSSETDDMSITSPILPKMDNDVKNTNNNNNPNEIPSDGEGNDTKKKLTGLKKVHHDLENWQKKIKNLRCQFTAENCFKGSLSKFIKKFKHNQSSKSKDNKDLCMYDDNMDVNCNDANNNALENHKEHDGLHNPLTNIESAEISDRTRCSMHYDTERNLYTIQMGSCSFFYRNGILSRRRLAAIPIRMHTRRTCLINSHISPYIEIPKGLQDCL